MCYKPDEMVVIMSVKERDEMVENVKRFKKTLDDMRDVLADIKSFERTKELLKADKEGRCIILPFKFPQCFDSDITGGEYNK